MSLLRQWHYPMLLHQSSHAALLYTTNDLAFEIPAPYLAQIDIPDIVQKAFGNKPIRDLMTLPPHQINVFSCRSNNESVNSSLTYFNTHSYPKFHRHQPLRKVLQWIYLQGDAI